MAKPDFRIIPFRLRSSQKDDLALRMQSALSELNQLHANAFLLAGNIHRQIRHIAAVTEIRHRPRHSQQSISVPRRANEIRVLEHRLNALNIMHRAPLRQSGSLQNVNELLRCNLAVVEVINFHQVATTLYSPRQYSNSNIGFRKPLPFKGDGA